MINDTYPHKWFLWITYYRADKLQKVGFQFGQINVVLDGENLLLRDSVKSIKRRKGCFSLYISSFEGALNMTRKNNYFEKFANITVSGIRSLSLHMILNLWKNRARVHSHVSVKVAKLSLVISNICLEYYKFRIRDSYCLVLLY